ncbi:myosin-7B-like [Photinus pyralis]|uniref:myosin-7B-like n=1 Tax=Photinus pyralis TaxID=7054 RepID=UPI0012677E36|nr:myosin-7B-like [Photinus pyralis]
MDKDILNQSMMEKKPEDFLPGWVRRAGNPTPPTVVCPRDTGGATNHATTNQTEEEAVDRAGSGSESRQQGGEFATDEEGKNKIIQQAAEDDRIVRRPSLMRTPPEETKSTHDDRERQPYAWQKKRKTESSPGLLDDRSKEDSNREVVLLRKKMDEINMFIAGPGGKNVNKTLKDLVREMEGRVRATENRREAETRARARAENLTGKQAELEESVVIGNMKESIEELQGRHEEMKKKLQEMENTNKKLEREVEKANARYAKLEKEYTEEKRQRGRRKAEIREEIAEALSRETRDLETFLSIVEEEWPAEEMGKVKTSNTNPEGFNREWDIVFYVEDDVEMEGPVAREMKACFPMVDKLNRGDINKKGEYLYCIQGTWQPGEGWIRAEYYGKLINTAAEDRMEGVYRAIEELREVCREAKRKKVVIAMLDNGDAEAVRKAAIYLLEGMEVVITAPGEGPDDEEFRTKEERRTRKNKKGGATRNTRERPEAVLIKLQGKEEYAKVLQKVRSTEIGNDEVKVRGVTQTREGDILVHVEKGEGKAELLRRRLAESTEGREVRVLQDTTVIEIRDLDGVTTGEEVIEAVKKAHPGAMPKVLRITKVSGERQYAKVALEKKIAEKLIEEGRLRVALTSCRVRESEKKIDKCFRCWEARHIGSQCKGTDRSSLCHNCGKEGHNRRGGDRGG